MGRIDNLKADELGAFVRRHRQLATATPQNNASVSDGQFSFYGLFSILVEGSGLVTGLWDIDGELRVGGELNGSGEFTWTGPVNLVGDTEVSGDFDIISGGIFRAGNLTITPGGVITGASGLIFNPNGILSVQGSLNVTGNTTLSPSVTTGSAANVFMNGTTGLISRSTSASKYKLLPEVFEISDALLDVPVEWWFDRAPIERYVALMEKQAPLSEDEQVETESVTLRRIPGLIAEKVAEAGGEAFITYDAEGEIDGLAYDRLAIARTAIAARRIAELEEIVRATTARLEKLEATRRS